MRERNRDALTLPKNDLVNNDSLEKPVIRLFGGRFQLSIALLRVNL